MSKYISPLCFMSNDFHCTVYDRTIIKYHKAFYNRDACNFMIIMMRASPDKIPVNGLFFRIRKRQSFTTSSCICHKVH